MKPDKKSPQYKEAITVDRMRRSDAYTIANFTDSKELMYRAAEGIFDTVDWKGKKIAIVTGSGNNGGDGYALAGIMAQSGIKPTIIRTSERFSADGGYYFKIAKDKGVEDIMFEPGTSLDEYDIICDCILGTGFSGTPRGIVADAIQAINNSCSFVVCADINSGLDGDTGKAELAVKSDLTVSIGYYKKGMFINDAPNLISELMNVDIGIVLIP